MVDSVIAGTGNSRYLRTSLSASTTWEDALTMLRAGTFPIDLAGINQAGFTTLGTALNSATLLKSAVITALGLDADATPSDAWDAVIALISEKADADSTVTSVAYNSATHKLTVTIDGVTTDVVTITPPPVNSVNTKTGDVVLGSGDIAYSDSATYPSGSVGAEVSDLKGAFDKLVDDTIDIVTGKNRCPPDFYNGYINASGVITEYSDWKTTDFIDVRGLSDIVASGARANNAREPITLFFLTTYNANKERIEQVSNPNTTYTVGEGVGFVRFSFHSNDFHDIQVEAGTEKTDYEPFSQTYKAVNDDYALKSNVDEIGNTVDELVTEFSDIGEKYYNLYTPNFSESPSAIWDDGTLITTLADTKTTGYIDCSAWLGIRYTGANWLGARAIAFYDENKTWISSIPAVGNTTYYTNEIISIPSTAKYVVFGDLTAKVTQTLKIEVAEQFRVKGKWSGKKWVCVGDSLTEHNNRALFNYHDYVADATGITVVNMGVSGSGYARSAGDNNAFYQRIANCPADADVVTIFGSFNDLGAGLSLGTVTDSGTTTLAGCINETLDVLQETIPLVNVGIVAPTPWSTTQPTTSGNAYDYVEMLKAICEHRSIPFLDLWRCSNLRPWDADFRAVAYTRDEGNGTHPDENGHKLIAPRFEAFIDSLLLH